MVAAVAEKATRRGRWATKAELSAELEYTRNWLDQSILPKLSDADIDRTNRSYRYRLRAVFDAVRRGADLENGDADLFGGSDSPHLERVRKLSGDKLELQLQRERGELLERSQVRAMMSQAAEYITRASERLEARFGREAHAILDGALREYEEAVRRGLEDGDGG